MLLKGLEEGNFKEFKIVKLELDMRNCEINSKIFEEALAKMINLNILKLDYIDDNNYKSIG